MRVACSKRTSAIDRPLALDGQFAPHPLVRLGRRTELVERQRGGPAPGGGGGGAARARLADAAQRDADRVDEGAVDTLEHPPAEQHLDRAPEEVEPAQRDL